MVSMKIDDDTLRAFCKYYNLNHTYAHTHTQTELPERCPLIARPFDGWSRLEKVWQNSHSYSYQHVHHPSRLQFLEASSVCFSTHTFVVLCLQAVIIIYVYTAGKVMSNQLDADTLISHD